MWYRLTIYYMLLLTIVNCSEDEEKIVKPREGRDSYIDAYHESHITEDQKGNERQSKYAPVYDQVSAPDQHYGYPEHHYPAPSYGPPVYGPPQPSFPSSYGMPHAMLGLLDKFHLKLDIFTILKILLKLVIFKKIVSFIAILCLLLFIPKFKMVKDEEDTEDSRSYKQGDTRINTLAQYVLGAIEKYSTKNATCDGINCKVDRIKRDIDNMYPYHRILSMYAQEDR